MLTHEPTGTRSVSTLTPSQLARKRANDREAQRAIRARTKEHIERLERELDELRSHQSRDRTVQDLLRRNKALEDELRRLKENMGTVSMNSSPYSAPAGTTLLATGLDADSLHHKHQHHHAGLLSQSLARLTPSPSVFDDNLSTTSGGAPPIPSPQMSPLPSAADYAPLPEFGQQQQHQHQQQHQQHQYVGMPNSCETWAATIPSTAAGMPPSVPSPSPSIADEYGASAAYIPTSVPASMMPSNKDVKLEFDNMQSMGQGYMHHEHPHHQPQQRNAAWNVYPMYYDGAQQAVGVSR